MKITNNFLTLEQLNKLSTKRLLAYRNKLLSYPEEDSVIDKSSPDWIKTYDLVVTILSSREHIEK